MNDKCICEKCGAEMKPLSDIYPVGMTCPNCGWGWATTYIDPINLDEINYHVILVSSDNSLSNIKMVSETANCNYVEAKKLINNVPVEVFHGQAVEVKTIKENFEKADINFRIEPEFPY
jgi:large subunit ribosomal protein L7/L12